jgi:hypothetical protein
MTDLDQVHKRISHSLSFFEWLNAGSAQSAQTKTKQNLAIDESMSSTRTSPSRRSVSYLSNVENNVNMSNVTDRILATSLRLLRQSSQPLSRRSLSLLR